MGQEGTQIDSSITHNPPIANIGWKTQKMKGKEIYRGERLASTVLLKVSDRLLSHNIHIDIDSKRGKMMNHIT